ncbi:hypothetical protein PIB30_083334, partial [Stylosanthes scabra]|nr:hypothetical protein [Stylosanthes scabra]
MRAREALNCGESPRKVLEEVLRKEKHAFGRTSVSQIGLGSKEFEGFELSNSAEMQQGLSESILPAT